jgi:hypothetical protein
MKYLVITILVLATCLYIAVNGYINRGIIIAKQEAQIEVLRDDIQRRDNNDVVKQERKEEVKKVIKEDKTGFDWDYNISNSPVIKLLQKQCQSCGG